LRLFFQECHYSTTWLDLGQGLSPPYTTAESLTPIYHRTLSL